MNESRREDADLAELLAEHARREAGADQPGPPPTPEPEELLAMIEDRLPPDAAQRLERRLIADPDAARDLLDLADFAAAEAAAGTAPPEVATHAGWRDFQRRLAAGAARRRRPPPWLGVAAAALFIAVIALAGWVWRLRTAEPAPQVVANLATLELATATRGDDPVVALPAGAPLRLVLAPEERCPEYRAEIARDGGSGDPWSGSIEGLRRDPLGRVTLLLPGGWGSYALVLSGCDPPQELERHRFRIVAEE